MVWALLVPWHHPQRGLGPAGPGSLPLASGVALLTGGLCLYPAAHASRLDPNRSPAAG